MRDYQTPQKEHMLLNRRSKSIAEHTKKPQKSSKKCLSSAFTSVSEDLELESQKYSISFPSFSEVSEDNQLGESAESSIVAMNPAASPSSETVATFDLTVLSSKITADKNGAGDFSVNHCASAELNGTKAHSIEREMVVKHLRQARIQVQNLTEADLQFKRLLDALVKVVIEEFYGLPEERDWFTELVSRKAHTVFLSFVLWILAVAAVFFSSSGVQSSFSEPPPT